jgi:hypothetical protein
MGIIKELREFIQDMKGRDRVIQVLENEVNRLELANQRLMDRVMSKDYRELQEYANPVVGPSGPTLDFTYDEHNAGEILEPEETDGN